jgi:very-short-patch-repair endonuclease
MGARDVDANMRVLARHQWVRDHGTPRVTTLAGNPRTGRELWMQWLALTGRARDRRRFLEQPAREGERWLAGAATRAAELAGESPREAIAIVVEGALLDRWLVSHDDRRAALIAEGIVHVTARRSGRATGPRAAAAMRARSLAELTLFDALEATAATAGRFQLNASVSFAFGTRGAEIDLLSRDDELAIEVDGVHHFAEPDAYRRDRRKDLLLQGHGYTVLRFLAEDVLADPRAAVQDVVQLLGHRRAHQRLHRKG